MACRLSCLVEPILRRSECHYRVGHLIDTLRKPACVPNGTLAFLDLTILLQRLPFTIPVTSLSLLSPHTHPPIPPGYQLLIPFRPALVKSPKITRTIQPVIHPLSVSFHTLATATSSLSTRTTPFQSARVPL